MRDRRKAGGFNYSFLHFVGTVIIYIITTVYTIGEYKARNDAYFDYVRNLDSRVSRIEQLLMEGRK